MKFEDIKIGQEVFHNSKEFDGISIRFKVVGFTTIVKGDGQDPQVVLIFLGEPATLFNLFNFRRVVLSPLVLDVDAKYPNNIH